MRTNAVFFAVGFAVFAVSGNAFAGTHTLDATESKTVYGLIKKAKISPTPVSVGAAKTPYHRVTVEPISCLRFPVAAEKGGDARKCDLQSGEALAGQRDRTEYHLYGDEAGTMHGLVQKFATTPPGTYADASTIMCYCPLTADGKEKEDGQVCRLVN